MTTPSRKQREDWPAIGTDILLIVVFAIIGMRNHDAALTAGDVAWTALPFAAGALITHLILFYRKVNVRGLVPGVIVWLGTWILGMLLRAVTGGGTPWEFVAIGGAFLALFLLGWRLIRWFVLRVRTPKES